jgi:hypothetical protein
MLKTYWVPVTCYVAAETLEEAVAAVADYLDKAAHLVPATALQEVDIEEHNVREIVPAED